MILKMFFPKFSSGNILFGNKTLISGFFTTNKILFIIK